jgi:hemoglobin
VNQPANSNSSAAPTDSTVDDGESVYDAVGGHDTFVRLVTGFYDAVAEDEVLTQMYPEEDLGPARERLLLFLEQYWGGPRTYSEVRGHPRLRARHLPYRVDADARDRWLACFRAGVDAAKLSAEHEKIIWDYAERSAHFMVNATD